MNAEYKQGSNDEAPTQTQGQKPELGKQDETDELKKKIINLDKRLTKKFADLEKEHHKTVGIAELLKWSIPLSISLVGIIISICVIVTNLVNTFIQSYTSLERAYYSELTELRKQIESGKQSKNALSSPRKKNNHQKPSKT